MPEHGAGAGQTIRLVRQLVRTTTVRTSVAAAAVLTLAACGGSDATGPGTTRPSLDPATIGATADRLQAVTSQPVIAAMLAQGSAAALPTFARNVVQIPQLTSRLPHALALRGLMTTAARLAPVPRLAPHATLGDPTALIPDSLLGRTLVPDPQGVFAVDPSRIGAPSNGVRFVIRNLGATQDLGYADLTEGVSGATATLTLDVTTTAGALVMHDVESTTIGTSSETDAFDGYVTNGADRIDYTVSVQSSASRSLATTTMTAPSANVAVADTSVLDGMTATDVDVARVTVGSTVIRITTPAVADTQYGGYIESDTSRVTVNGAPFATVTVDAAGTPSITAPDGSPLSASDMSALTSVEGILLTAGTVVLAPVLVVLWLLIATSAY